MKTTSTKSNSANTTDTTYLKQQVSCRVTNSILKYLESKGYKVDSVISGLAYSKEYLCDPFNWVEYEIREIITKRAAELTNNNAVMYDVGLSTPELNPLGGIEALVKLLAGPKTVYRYVPKYARLFDRVFKFKVDFNRGNQAIITMSLYGNYPKSKASCYYAQGILAAIPTLWGLPPAVIREKKCMCKPDDGMIKDNCQYETETCVWEVQWQPLHSWLRRLRDNLFFHNYRVSSDVTDLEQNFRLVDQKNVELVARNRQLAAVREIAISVDKVRTVDEALGLVVEQSREIEGVRFVLVQKLDETGEFVTTPYYSKFRNLYVVKAIKALGFDPEKELGDNPTSKKLRFPFSKLKAAQDYLKNPRVMVMPSLAELLDGIWPRTLCNSIQKILRVKKLVIVPLLIEGKSWGNMLYFLDQEVPIDILEMIGAHCALALKNIITLNSLELRNTELSALNRMANITSKSLDRNTLLHDAIEEIIDIFNADNAAIYLWNEASQTLKLVTQHGMPEAIVQGSSNISLQDSPIGKFFLSQDNILAGKMDDYIDQFPAYAHLKMKHAPHQFITSILHFGSARHGMVTMVRSSARQFHEDEKSLLISISNQLAVSLENSRLHADVVRRVGEAEIARANLEKSIEQQKSIEAELRQSEERYRTIFESANDILLLIDSKGKIIDVNGRVEDIGGYGREEVLGKDFRSLTKIMTKKSLLIAAKNYLKRMAGLDVPVYDVELKKKSGERVAIQINAMAIRKDKKITGDLAILRNITEIKQAEKNLKLQKDLIDRILATIPNAVLLLNRNLQVIMANKAFYKLFKLKKNLVENKPIEEIIVTTDLDQAILTIANGKEKNVSTEFRYSVASSEKTLLTNIFSMEEKNILLVINDITEERQRQERLYLTDRLASVGEMASGVAHELNNPLTSIIGLSELLTKQNMPNEAKEDLTAIHSEAQRCAKIVKNLLTFARKHNVSREPVQITEVVKEVLKLRSYEHRANNISTETRFPPDLPKVLADYFQMQQVFLNIILNAETAMFDANGRGTLKITGEAANNHVSISFADDGPGISKENMRLLFNPFFTTKEVGKGTGLGLSICYGIVASHGGRIYAESEYGKGATFTVELPALEY